MRYILLGIFLTIATFMGAQTQHGLVRTIGTSSHHGEPLSGAVVKIKGNNQQFLSGTNGTFELPIHNAKVGDKYQLHNVSKKGYELADKNFLNQTFVYSEKAPLEIVMLSPEEILKEKQAIESKVLNIAENNYKKRIDTLKQDYEQGRITLEAYRVKYQTLQEQFNTYDEMISNMAEHYARTDYDRLDSIEVMINTHIINGELDQADILLAQKGNLNDRIAAYQRHAATNTAAREMLDKLTVELQQQRQEYEKERDDISNDLYNKHSIAISRFDFDTALEMLKLRADLDTTNANTVWDYAELCYKQKKFTDCEKYYLICLSILASNKDLHGIAAIMNNLGALYCDFHDYGYSEKYLLWALERRFSLAQQHSFNRRFTLNGTHYIENNDGYIEELIETQNNLGILCNCIHDYINCEKYFKLALEGIKYLFKNNPDEYRADLAKTQNHLGNLYYKLHDHTKSKKYYMLALENKEALFNHNPNAYRVDLAQTQNDLGNLYRAVQDYANSEKYYMLALENNEQLFNRNPNAYRASLAQTQNNLGNLYQDIHDYTNCEKFYKLALENYEQLLGLSTEAYHTDLALTQNNLGALYCERHDYANSEKYYNLALENREQLFRLHPNTYREDLVSTLKMMAYCYLYAKRYDDAIYTIDKSIAIMPDGINLYDTKGEILLEQGKNEEALIMWKKVLELDHKFLKKHRAGTNLSNGLKKLGLIK